MPPEQIENTASLRRGLRHCVRLYKPAFRNGIENPAALGRREYDIRNIGAWDK